MKSHHDMTKITKKRGTSHFSETNTVECASLLFAMTELKMKQFQWRYRSSGPCKMSVLDYQKRFTTTKMTRLQQNQMLKIALAATNIA